MDHFLRFGRRFPVPSSLQISRELRLLSAEEDVRARCAEEDGLPRTARWDEIIGRRLLLAVKEN
jgi:hypothetical protein